MRLGNRQISCLHSLKTFGGYEEFNFNGWVWDTHSGTLKIMESLKRKNLVMHENGKYLINENGIKALSI